MGEMVLGCLMKTSAGRACELGSRPVGCLSSELTRSHLRSLFPDPQDGYPSQRHTQVPPPPPPSPPTGPETHASAKRFRPGTLPFHLSKAFPSTHPVWLVLGHIIHHDVFTHPQSHSASHGFALLKPNLLPRPIVVATWPRRLLGRILSSRFLAHAPSLSPLQFGLAKGGAEAIVHAVATLTHANVPNLSLTSLDIGNAYGTLPRSWIEGALLALNATMLNDLHLYAHHFLLSDSSVSFASRGSDPLELTIRTGLPQGDPMSPILFCLAIQHRLRNIESPTIKVIAYLDDIVVASSSLLTTSDVTSHVAAHLSPLTLNTTKCVPITSSSSLLGACLDNLTPSPSVIKASQRLHTLTSCPTPQHAIPLVRFAVSGANYSARLGNPVDLVSSALEKVLTHFTTPSNMVPPTQQITPAHMLLASLPYKEGGLGLPSPTITAPHQHSDSLTMTFGAASTIINHLTESPLSPAASTHLVSILSKKTQEALATSTARMAVPRPHPPPPTTTYPLSGTQTYKRPSNSRHATHQRRSDFTIAHLNHVDPTLSAHAIDNILTDPYFLSSCTQNLSPQAFVLALRSRLLIADPCISATCPHCNTHLPALTPSHLATCKMSATTRHNALRDIFARHAILAFGSSMVEVEPTGLCPPLNNRPADILIAAGTRLNPLKATALDVTVSSRPLLQARNSKLTSHNAAKLRAIDIPLIPIVFSPIATTDFTTKKTLTLISNSPHGPGGIMHDAFIVIFNYLAEYYHQRNVIAAFIGTAQAISSAHLQPPVFATAPTTHPTNTHSIPPFDFAPASDDDNAPSTPPTTLNTTANVADAATALSMPIPHVAAMT